MSLSCIIDNDAPIGGAIQLSGNGTIALDGQWFSTWTAIFPPKNRFAVHSMTCMCHQSRQLHMACCSASSQSPSQKNSVSTNDTPGGLWHPTCVVVCFRLSLREVPASHHGRKTIPLMMLREKKPGSCSKRHRRVDWERTCIGARCHRVPQGPLRFQLLPGVHQGYSERRTARNV